MKNPGNDDLWLAAVRTELRAEKKKDADALIAKALQVQSLLVALGFHHLYITKTLVARSLSR